MFNVFKKIINLLKSKQDSVVFPPEKLVVPHDDYHCKYVGKMTNGQQFFLTTPFTYAEDLAKAQEFVALYLFNADGDLIDHKINNLGNRASLVGEQNAKILPGNVMEETPVVQTMINNLLKTLGKISFENILIKPFVIEKFDLTFGIVPENYDDHLYGDDGFYDDMDDEEMTMIVEPGNYMAFVYPFDGEYDT